MRLNKRVGAIAPSVTLAITAKARSMKVAGEDVISLAAGEPDFDTPDSIKQAAIKAIKDGVTKYTPASGTMACKEAVCRKFSRDNSLSYKPEQVLVSCGAKHSLFNIIMAVADEGDKVLLPSPDWVSYPEMIRMSGAQCVLLPADADSGYKITPEQLKEAAADARALILNSPCNPTGMLYTRKELTAIAEICVENDIIVIADEIYEHLVYGSAKHVSIASLGDEIFNRTVTINGVSKAYSMTGWRTGFAAGPEKIIKAASALQSHSTSNPVSFVQEAVIEALDGDQKPVMTMRAEFEKRRDMIVSGLNAIDGISCVEPEGAFYAFPSVESLYDYRVDGEPVGGSVRLCSLLLDKVKVAAVPGAGFHSDSNIRLSYATGRKQITRALERIDGFVRQLQSA